MGEKSSVESRKIMKWISDASNQNNPREVQLVSPCSLHFHSKRFQQGSPELALPLCFSPWALTGKQHLKLFSDLLLSLQLYPCHWTTQSYWTSQWPAESIQVLPCLFVTLLSLSLLLTCIGVTSQSLFLDTEDLGLSEQFFLVFLSTSEFQKASSAASAFPTAAPCQTWFPINS